MKVVNCLLVTILLTFSLSSYAEVKESGKILPGWFIYHDGNLFFELTGTHVNSACPQIPERWAFDTTTPTGKSWLSVFLTAYTTGKDLQLEGSGTCVHGNTEGISHLYVIN